MKFRIAVFLLLAAGCRHFPIPVPEGDIVPEYEKCPVIPPQPIGGWMPDTITPVPLHEYMGPCFNPSNGDEIVCVRENTQTGYNDLCVVNLKTHEQKVLNTGREAFFQPRWSKKNWVLFSSGSQLYRVDAGGGNLMQITFEGHNSNPVLSPEGDRILFNRHVNGKYYKILTDENGSPIDTVPHVDLYGETWSWDGRKLITYKDSFFSTLDASDKETIHKLSKDVPGDGYTCWLRDNVSVMLFSIEGVWRYNTETNKKNLLRYPCPQQQQIKEPIFYRFPSVSPDGNTVIVERVDFWYAGGDMLRQEVNLWLMDTKGKNLRKLEF